MADWTVYYSVETSDGRTVASMAVRSAGRKAYYLADLLGDWRAELTAVQKDAMLVDWLAV